MAKGTLPFHVVHNNETQTLSSTVVVSFHTVHFILNRSGAQEVTMQMASYGEVLSLRQQTLESLELWGMMEQPPCSNHSQCF